MARLAAERDTHLTRAEIAAEALRQFDEGPREPSIRSLAAALRVAPTAIYHHFPSQAAIYQAVVELVWNDSLPLLLEIEPRPLEADPGDTLVAVGLATRRAWMKHHRVAPYMAATPQANEFNENALGLFANLFERLGLEGEEVVTAFHSYASLMFGSTLFAATRMAANEQLDRGNSEGHIGYRPRGHTKKRTRLSISEVPDLSVVDPVRDEELYAEGLRRLIESFRPKRSGRRRAD
jgi:AcrR family transcriptional regulator